MADWLKITPKSVYCWTYPKNRGGTGGTIPQKYHLKLIKKASAEGINLGLGEFYGIKGGTLNLSDDYQ